MRSAPVSGSAPGGISKAFSSAKESVGKWGGSAWTAAGKFVTKHKTGLIVAAVVAVVAAVFGIFMAKRSKRSEEQTAVRPTNRVVRDYSDMGEAAGINYDRQLSQDPRITARGAGLNR